MSSRKSPHESSLLAISNIETETHPVFEHLSIGDLFYVDRCLDEKIQSLAIDHTLIDQERLALEVEQFKEKSKMTVEAIEMCRSFQEKLTVVVLQFIY